MAVRPPPHLVAALGLGTVAVLGPFGSAGVASHDRPADPGPRAAPGPTVAAATSFLGPCDDPAPAHGPDGDLYCLELMPVPGLDGVVGRMELGWVPTPFGVAVSRDGRQRHAATLHLAGLPDPAELGPYSTYVAWLTTPLLHPSIRMGEVGNGSTPLGVVELDKFLVLVSAEASSEVDERSGRVVLRGLSPSSRMQPADMFEFLVGGGTGADGDTGGPGRATGPQADHGAHEPRDAGAEHGARGPRLAHDARPVRAAALAWVHPSMPEGLVMLPGEMELLPRVSPYLPAADEPEAVPWVRPRELLPLSDGDTVALAAGFVRRAVAGRTHVMYGFNGQYPGPLIQVSQAATIVVDFTNRIDWPTTVHWHGIRLENASDGVPGVTQEPVLPGETFRYTIHFPDAGIYWYHPHVREDVQQDLGLYGNLLVRSPRPDWYGPAHREEVLMLDDLLVGEEGLVPYGLQAATHALNGRFGNVLLVNGEPVYRLRVGRGEVVRFFLTNASNTRTFNLSFGGAPMKVVGTDVGNFVREAPVESVVVAPAERYVVHVRFEEAGEVAFENRVRAIDHLFGAFFPRVDTLGTVHVGEDGAEPDLSEAFATLREDSVAAAEIDAFRRWFDRPVDRVLELDMETRDLPLVTERLMVFDSAYFHPVEWDGTMPMMNMSTTGREVRWILRDASSGRENMDIDWRFRVGDVAKVRLVNRRDALHAMHHPVHIHGQRFLVLSVNGVPNPHLAWKDTMLLPVGATADILLELSNPGRWMAHCHIAEHLETGMMTVFEVEDDENRSGGAR